MNIIKALAIFSKNPYFELPETEFLGNRIQAQGDRLESLAMDIFAGVTKNDTEELRSNKYSQAFSYTGSKNNLPDLLYKNGPAIEVKKTGTVNELALNSSYPKSTLLANDPKIHSECKDAITKETPNRLERAFFYTAGIVKKNQNKCSRLWIVDGTVYAAAHSEYQTLLNTISDTIQQSGYTLAETNEIARINDVDPLKRTYLRVRGMWGITHPEKVFKDKHTPKNNEVILIISKQEYSTYPESDRKKLEKSEATISDIQVRNPNNPVTWIDAKLIVIS